MTAACSRFACSRHGCSARTSLRSCCARSPCATSSSTRSRATGRSCSIIRWSNAAPRSRSCWRTPDGALALAPWTALEAGAGAETIHERFEASRADGNEGLVFKRTDSPYTPGRRGKAWLKLKRELATLDCVVVAVERGHGRRVNVLVRLHVRGARRRRARRDREGVQRADRRGDRRDDGMVRGASASAGRSPRRVRRARPEAPRDRRRAGDRRRDRVRHHPEEHAPQERLRAALPADRPHPHRQAARRRGHAGSGSKKSTPR